MRTTSNTSTTGLSERERATIKSFGVVLMTVLCLSGLVILDLKAKSISRPIHPAPHTFWIKSGKLVADDVVQFNLTIVDRTDIRKFCDKLVLPPHLRKILAEECTRFLNKTIREGLQSVCGSANAIERSPLPILNSTAKTMSLLLPVTVPQIPNGATSQNNFIEDWWARLKEYPGIRLNEYEASTLIATAVTLQKQFALACTKVREGKIPGRLLQVYNVQPPCTDNRCDEAHPYLHDCVEENGGTFVLRYSFPTRINPDRIVYEKHSFKLAEPHIKAKGNLCVEKDLEPTQLLYDMTTSCKYYWLEEVWPGMILFPKTDSNCSKIPKPDQVDKKVTVDLSMDRCDYAYSRRDHLVQYFCDGKKTAVYCPFANITVGSGSSEETSPCPDFPFYVEPGYVFYKNGKEFIRATAQNMKMACERFRTVVGVKL